MRMKQLFRLATLASLALLASSARATMTLIADWNDFRSLTSNGYVLVLGSGTEVDTDGDGITIGTGGAYIDLGSAFHNCTVEIDCMVESDTTTQEGTLVSYMTTSTTGTAIALVQLSSTTLDRTWGTAVRNTTYTSDATILSSTTARTFTQVYAYGASNSAIGTTTYLDGTQVIAAETGLRAGNGVYRVNLGRSDANDTNLYTGLRILRVRLYGSSSGTTYPTADEVASSYATIVSDRSATTTTYTLSANANDTDVELEITASNTPGMLVSGAREITTSDGGMTIANRFFLPQTDATTDSLTFSDGYSPYTGSVSFTTGLPISFQNNIDTPTLTLNGSGDVTIRKGESDYGVVLSDGGYTGTVTLYNGQPLTRGSTSTFTFPLNIERDTTSTAASVINNNGENLQFTGVISGSGDLDFQGAGITTITNTENTFSGDVTVTSGSVYVGYLGDQSSGTDSVFGTDATTITVKDGASFYTHLGGSGKTYVPNFVLENGSTLGNRDGHVTLEGDIAISGAVSYRLFWNKSNTFSGVISGDSDATLTIGAPENEDGKPTLTLGNADNTFKGTYVVNGTNSARTVTLVTSSTAATSASVTLANAYSALTLGDSASVNVVTNNGGTVTLGASDTVTELSNTGTVTVGAGTTVTTVSSNAGTITLSGDVTMSTITTGTGTIASSASGTSRTVTIGAGDLTNMTLTDIAINKTGTGTLALGTLRPTLAGVEGTITLTADGAYTFPTTLADGTTIAASCFSLTDAATGASVTAVAVSNGVLTLTVTGTPVGELSTTISADTTLETLISASTTSWTDASSVSWSGDLLAGYTDTLTINSDTAVTLTVEVDENGATIVDLVHLALGSNVTLALVSATEGTAVTLADGQETSAALVDITSDVTLDSAQLTADAVTLTGEGTLVFTATSTSALTTAATGLNGLTDSANWTGIVQLTGVAFEESESSVQTGYLETLGNANSTIELVGTNTGYLRQAASCAATLKITGTMTFSNGFSTNGGYTFTGALTGSGTLATANNQTDVIAFTGDVSKFAGTVTVAGQHCIAIGAYTDGGNNTSQVSNQIGCLRIVSGSSITIPTGMTWTAANGIYVEGTLTVEGSTASAVTVAETTGSVKVTGGTLSGAVTVNGSATVSSGTVSGATTIASTGSAEISGGTVTGAVAVNGSATISGGTISTPTDASTTISVASGGAVTISGGTVSKAVSIASGGSVTLSSATALTGTVTGAGTLVFSGIAPTTSNLTSSGLTDSTGWTGTVSVVYAASSSTRFYLESYGNASSTVEFNGSTGYLTADSPTFTTNIKLTDSGWKSTNGNSSATLTFTGSLTGDGTLDLSGSTPSSGHLYKFTGTVADFTGSVTVANNQRVAFGDVNFNTTGAGKIAVATTATIASGATWSTANGITVTSAGTLGGAGAISGTLTLADGATISVTDTTSPLTVSGTVTCGDTLNVVLPSGTTLTAGTPVTILSTTSTVTAPTTAVVTSDGTAVSNVVVQYTAGTGLTATLPKVPEAISGLDTSSSTSTVTEADVAAVTEVLQELAAAAGVTTITEIKGTTKTSATTPTEITDAATLVSALTLFENIATVTTDTETSTTTATVAYNFGISSITIDDSGNAVVTAKVQNTSDATATFASGTKVYLVIDGVATEMTKSTDGTTATLTILASALTSGTTTIDVKATNTTAE